jgi:hypothetical protein
MTTQETKTERKAGDRVGNIGRLGSKMAAGYPIWTGAIFEAKPRKRDGVLTWRRVGNFGDTRSGNQPSATFELEIEEVAEAADIERCDEAKHNGECNQ